VPTPTDLDEVVDLLVPRLWEVVGVKAVAVLGEHGSGLARSDADREVLVLYRDALPLDTRMLRDMVDNVNDTVGLHVTDLGGWGPWMNGGAQLTIGRQRVDLLYRSIDRYDHAITQAQDGHAEHDWLQLPPYGFPSVSYLGEIDLATVILDPKEEFHDLKERVRPYPLLLKRNLITGFLWGAQHTLDSIRLSAARNDVFAAMGGLTRAAAMLSFAIYAMNERYYVADRGALDVMATFAVIPPHCHARIHDALREPHLPGAVEQLNSLIEETRRLSKPLLR
jgi:hypothetical protein